MASATEVAAAKALANGMAMRARRLGGTITGEHGAGFGKCGLVDRVNGPAWAVMGTLKYALDPMNRVNPGKLVPDQS